MSLPQFISRKFHNLTHPVLGRILMLHRVVEHRSEEPKQRELEVTPTFLERTIQEYLSKGYRFVSMDQVCGILKGKDKGKPFVCLTFDDGYRDNYTVAYPLLKRLGIPFAVYVTTGFVDQTAKMWWYEETEVMSWEQIKTLAADSLCTIGAHTVSHPRLSTLTEEEARREIMDSKHRLEDMLGCVIDHFSYPHGDYNEAIVNMIKSNGFCSALMAWGGVNRKGVDHFQLHRTILQQ